MTCDHCGKEKPCIVDKKAEVTICADCRAGIEVVEDTFTAFGYFERKEQDV